MDTRRSAKSDFWGVAPYQRPAADEVADTQRRRLLLGVTRAVVKKGYAGFSVADVLDEVRISRKTFYEMFRDKEECFLAAYEIAHVAMIDAVTASQRGISDTLVRLQTAHRVFLSFMQEHSDVAMAFLVGIIEAGPGAFERRQRAFLEFGDLHAVLHQQCRRQHPELPDVPRQAFVALSAGTNIIVIDELRKRGPAKLLELLPTVLYLTYSVYGLHAQAAAAVGGPLSRVRRKTKRH